MDELLVATGGNDNWVLSPDGSKIYLAGTDGKVRVYSATDGSLLQTYDVGTFLNGVAISPDGQTLGLSEGTPLPNPGNTIPRVYVITQGYALDLATGNVTSYVYDRSTNPANYVFADVAFAGNDTIRFVQQGAGPSGGGAPVVSFNLATGARTEAGYFSTPDGLPATLTQDEDGTILAADGGGSTGGRLYQMAPDGTFDADNGSYQNGYSGPTRGVEAYSGSLASDRIAISVENGLFVYDGNFNFLDEITDTYPGLVNTPGMTLSEDGSILYAISTNAGQIIAIDTTSFAEITRYEVGSLDFAVSPIGEELVLTPDGRHFLINTQQGIYCFEIPTDITGTPENDDLTGTDGKDRIFGLGGDDVIQALGGNDTIDGGLGADTMSGGMGDDTYFIDNLGDKIIEDAGEGNDTLILNRFYYELAPDADIERIEISSLQGTGTVILYANDVSQLIIGHDGIDEFHAGDGADTLFGGAGNDTLFGDDGNDEISGQDGDDYLVGGGGLDTLLGGSGNDQIFGGEGADTIRGGSGDDVLLGGFGGDDIQGGDGNDRIEGDGFPNGVTDYGDDTLDGGAGDDVITGMEGNDTILGGLGNDDLRGGEGADSIDGGDGNDLIIDSDTSIADSAQDILAGGSGNDQIYGGYGDTIDGGSGFDTLSLDLILGSAGVTADFRILTSGESVSISGFEIKGIETVIYIRLTQFDDFVVAGDIPPGNVGVYMSGNGGNDVLIGSAGADRLSGDDGDDLLIGGTGYDPDNYIGDAMFGGAGVDTVSYEQDGASIFVNLTLGRGFTNTSYGDTFDGIENVIGSSADDFIIGDTGVNRLDGGDGNDILLGAFGADTIIGGAGNDWASYEENSGTVFVNLTLGRGYNNGAEGDTLEGIENLVGGLFDDFFIGDENGNRLNGAMGADTLLGAGGADVFVFTYAPGATSDYGSPNVDLILDFTTGEDIIELSSGAFAGLSAGALADGAFFAGSAAHDADDRIIYDSATGRLWFDADGDGAGAAMLFATLGESSHPATIAASDFVVV